MALNIHIVRKGNKLEAVAGKRPFDADEVVAELREDAGGFNTLAALIGPDTTHSLLLRKALELMCLKMFTLGMEVADRNMDSSPSLPPP